MREVPDPEEFEEAARNPAAEGDDRAGPGLPDDQGQPIAMDAAGSEEEPSRKLRSKRQEPPALGDREEGRPVIENREVFTSYWCQDEAVMEIDFEMSDFQREIKQFAGVTKKR